jgi:hypothetical protein
VKVAAICDSVLELRQRLEEQLSQNSPETRRLYAQRIATWLFPSKKLDSAPLLVWKVYQDEQILLDHFRVRYLEAIPLLGKFVSGPMTSLGLGDPLTTDSIRAFISLECGRTIPDTQQRLPKNLSRLGFLKQSGRTYVRTIPSYNPLSVVLELHRIFSTEPVTIPFAEIAAHPFWRYIGVPDATTLEQILYWGVTTRLLAKFVKSDELNQVTTAYSYVDLLRLQPNPKPLNGRG